MLGHGEEEKKGKPAAWGCRPAAAAAAAGGDRKESRVTYPLRVHVDLVAHQDLVHVVRRVLLYVADPVSNVYKLIKKKINE